MLASKWQVPVVATNDVHYLRHEDCHAQDAMLCIATGAKLDNPDRWRMDTDTLFFRSREQMNRIFGDLPEALRNTLQVAEQINVEIEFGKYRLPHFVPPEGLNTDEYFRKLCEEGFARYYPGNPPEARERALLSPKSHKTSGGCAGGAVLQGQLRAGASLLCSNNCSCSR